MIVRGRDTSGQSGAIPSILGPYILLEHCLVLFTNGLCFGM